MLQNAADILVSDIYRLVGTSLLMLSLCIVQVAGVSYMYIYTTQIVNTCTQSTDLVYVLLECFTKYNVICRQINFLLAVVK